MPYAPARSQFSDASIPMNEALSLCGPAAALAFSSVNGRTPTLKEARDLAKSVGWTADAGMAGPASEQALLAKMGVQAELTPSADWNRVTQDVQGGRPVIISTPRHYFTVSDYDPAKGFYVGTSGTDLKGGAEWMTDEQITTAGRGVNGALHLTNAPTVPRAQQQFTEANSPGQSAAPASAGAGGATSPSAATPPAADPLAPPTTAAPIDPLTGRPEHVEDPELTELKRASAFSKALLPMVPENEPLPSYRLPGPPTISLGWKRFQLPQAGY
jgi:hypothetical protein